MDRNAKNILVQVSLFAAGVAIGLTVVKLLEQVSMVFAKYGLGSWEEDECECCNGSENCHCK